MDTAFQQAVESRGDTYLEAEASLRQGGAAAATTLPANRQHTDPIARLIVEVLLAWIQGGQPEYQAALDYLAYLPVRMAKTLLGQPPPIGVANELSERFGGRVADLLALRLVKQEDWPRWQVIGVLLYLQQQKLPSTTSALLRFAADTDNDEARGYAIEAIRAIADSQLPAKLAAERARLQGLRRVLPAELDTFDSRVDRRE